MNLDGLDITDAQLAELFAINPATWEAEADLTQEYFAKFGDHLPPAMADELAQLRARLSDA